MSDHKPTFSCRMCNGCCEQRVPWTATDIARVARAGKLNGAKFFRTEGGKYYEKAWRDKYTVRVPCSFLGAGNKCTIRDVRPDICRNYSDVDYNLGRSEFIGCALFQRVMMRHWAKTQARV